MILLYIVFLSHFGFREFPIAEFATILILELHKKDDEYHVAIKYNPHPDKNPNLSDLRTYKMPIGQVSCKMEEAEEGMHTLEEFEDYLFNFKKSYQSAEEWRTEGEIGKNPKKKEKEGESGKNPKKKEEKEGESGKHPKKIEE